MAENGECSNTSNGFHADEDEMMVYKKDATSVVSFRIVYSKDDMVSRKTGQFKPDMAHQVFGESECIFGYRSVSIDFYYLHNSAHCYLDLQKSGEIGDSDIYKPDDILKCLNVWLPDSYTTDKEEFLKMTENEKHDVMFGTIINEFKDKQECKLFPNQKVYANYKFTVCDMKEEGFKEFHTRFQSYIVWFIDAACYIDLDDEKWMIFYVYEEFEHPETKQTYRTAVGFCTLYKFYAYPNNVRARISQFFILPPYQRRGIGTKLYQTLVMKMMAMPEVIDITVEEPIAIFQKIRDFHDGLTVLKVLEDCKIDINSCNKKKIFEIMRKNKICKRQSQRMYDILGCYQAGKYSSVEYKKYINDIKNRIVIEIEKETRGSKRICNLERIGVLTDYPDRNMLASAEYKRYIEDIEPSIKYLQQNFTSSK